MPVGTFTAVLHKEGELYVDDCPEVGPVSPGKTVEEAVANLQEATEVYLEEFPPSIPVDPSLRCLRPDLPKLPRVSGAQAIRTLEKARLRSSPAAWQPGRTQAIRCFRDKRLCHSAPS